MSLYLTRAEVEELTDRHTKPAQEKRLRELGIPFLPGKPPKVLRSIAQGKGGAPEPIPAPSGMEGYAQEPDFSVFERRA